MRDEFRGRRASCLRHAVYRDVRWKKGGRVEITNLGKADGMPPVDWAAVAEKLDAGAAPAPDVVNARTTWLSTINEDGSPHVTAVGGLWLDGTFWFQTGSAGRSPSGWWCWEWAVTDRSCGPRNCACRCSAAL
jgi:Pyridoxamine 5'-phosphate oxidase